jgi:formylglycine-generating enzyme required for sulfatase activity
MKSQVWMLLFSLLLVCGTIGCGEKPEPVVEKPQTAVEQTDTDVSKPDAMAGSPVEITNSIGMKLKLIPAGEFVMGDPDSGSVLSPPEEPQHEVRITQSFYLGVTEVTQEQYAKVMAKNPSKFKDDSNPVDTASWTEAVEFCKRLSAQEGKTYRLPTEAEWEYACRAGTTTAYSFGDDAASLGEYAWYDENSDRRTHSVGEKKPNAWGLYDMHGNVSEWCQDMYAEYTSDAVTDPVGTYGLTNRVDRGGSWFDSARNCRSAYRNAITMGSRRGPRLGMRGFRVAQGQSSE